MASESMSCLQSLKSCPFNSKLSPFVFHIKSIINYLNETNYLIQFIWVSSHIDLHGNKVADSLAKSTSNLILTSFNQLPWTNFTPILQCHITNLWSNYWTNLTTNFASKFKNLVPIIQNKKT